MKEIEAAVEGILFASGEPVAVDRICVALDMDRPTVELVLQRLQDYYSYERRGIRLLKMDYILIFSSQPINYLLLHHTSQLLLIHTENT